MIVLHYLIVKASILAVSSAFSADDSLCGQMIHFSLLTVVDVDNFVLPWRERENARLLDVELELRERKRESETWSLRLRA